MACYFTGDIAQLTSLLQFETSVLLMPWFVSFIFVLRQEAMDFIILPMVFCPIRTLVYQTSADLLERFGVPNIC